MLDFTNEDAQKDFVYGPVPAGSTVVVEMQVLMPQEAYQAPEDCYISRSSKGLRQIYCHFTVTRGQYEGVNWRENITLPVSMQHENLTSGQLKGCQIGGATLKAILQSAGKPLKLQHIREFSGMKFPVKVKINDRPAEKDGNTYWNNAIYKVVTPDMKEYQEVKHKGEIINQNGAVTGNNSRKQKQESQNNNISSQKPPSMDDYVF